MAFRLRRTPKGATVIRASGRDAQRLLDAITGCLSEQTDKKTGNDAQDSVPNRSNSIPGATAAAAAPSASTAAPAGGAR